MTDITQTPDLKLSLRLQEIANGVEATLSEASGVDHCPFVLIALPESNAQYVANVKREDGVALIRNLLERWGNPSHGLPPLPEHQKDEMIASLLATAKEYHDIVDTLMAMLIAETAGTPRPFRPTTMAFWPSFVKCTTLMRDIASKIAFAREVSDNGPMQAPAHGERH